MKPNSCDCLKPRKSCDTCSDAYECGRNDEAADLEYERMKDKRYDADPGL